MKKPAVKYIETIIEGRPDARSISKALETYETGLLDFAYPADTKDTKPFENVDFQKLKTILKSRLQQTGAMAQKIILEINTRSKTLASPDYQKLINRDRGLWQTKNDPETNFAVLACVDKGIPYEAVIGVDGVMGRTLAGDISISHSPSRRAFFANEQIIIKRLIHMTRQGEKLFIEPLIEHTGCGRRGQMLANEKGMAAIPTLGYIFRHLTALESEFAGKNIKSDLSKLQELWQGYGCRGRAIVAPDGGLLAGVLLKIAQRQALYALNTRATIVCPIEIYDKKTGDLITGIDQLENLTHPAVLKEQGLTDAAVQELVKSGRIFSLKKYWPQITQLLSKSGISEGLFSHTMLQTDWLSGQKKLVDLTACLWQAANSGNPQATTVVQGYLQSSLGQIEHKIPDNLLPTAHKRLTHHLFHVISYAYLLGTIRDGHPPGLHHIEDHLAIGDHEIGTKTHLALGQGDLDDPSASEMFTGYSVLLHSKPGHDHTPIPVMIKLDTDRRADKPLSTEETRVAMNDFAEFLKLWPYFLAGELIPYLVVRSKATGGVSRLALSVILTFNDIIRLFEQIPSPLPLFTPAVNSQSEVVYVPSNRILEITMETDSDLGVFRKRMTEVADKYSNPAVQAAFASAY